MGEEPRSVTTEQTESKDNEHAEKPEEKDPEQEVGELEEDIAETRERLSVYLSELDHRRHRVMKTVKRGGALILGLTALTIAAIAVLGRRKTEQIDEER